MSKTTEQRIEEMVTEVIDTKSFDEVDGVILTTMLEALVLSAKLDQLKESK